MEALFSNDFFNFIIYDTISATPYYSQDPSDNASFLHDTNFVPRGPEVSTESCSSKLGKSALGRPENSDSSRHFGSWSQKKRRRKARVFKSKEQMETQRMTHIAVERNRRKQMNEHLAVLRSLMPESYAQRGDQTSIVGGAIEFVKELEHLLQTLEAQKLQLELQKRQDQTQIEEKTDNKMIFSPPFSQFFVNPQFNWSQNPTKTVHESTTAMAAVADVEVTLIETHANLRILSRKNPRNLSFLVAGFQALYFTVLHLNVTTINPLVLYSISAKVEEECQLRCVDDIAAGVHQMLSRIMEEEEEEGYLY